MHCIVSSSARLTAHTDPHQLEPLTSTRRKRGKLDTLLMDPQTPMEILTWTQRRIVRHSLRYSRITGGQSSTILSCLLQTAVTLRYDCLDLDPLRLMGMGLGTSSRMTVSPCTSPSSFKSCIEWYSADGHTALHHPSTCKPDVSSTLLSNTSLTYSE
jgi:hypothetical protein